MLARSTPALGAGGSVLMHDGIGPGSRRRGAENTVRLIEPLTEAARGRGLRLVTVSQGGHGRGGTSAPGGRSASG
jgi:hypothetical protein